MGYNKISGQSNTPAMLPIGIAAGAAFMLPPGQGLVGGFGSATLPQIGTGNPLTGQYLLTLGQYTNLQQFNTGMEYWEDVQVNPLAQVSVSADGVNYRVVNSTGCPVGAVITNAGSAYTNGFYGYQQFGAGSGGAITIIGGAISTGQTYLTVTPNAGGSLWNAIIGGAVSATMSVSGTVYNGNYGVNNTFGASTGGVTASGGSAYTRVPLVVFSPPANQGVQPYVLPTAIAAISGGAVSSITVLDQGCGLLGLPGVQIVNQPGDSTGGGAVVGWSSSNNGNIGTGSLLALWPAFYGSAQSAIVTLTFSVSSGSGASAAATSVMNWTITGVTAGTPGVGYGTTPGGVINGGLCTATPAANTCARYGAAISIPQFPPFTVTTASGLPVIATAASLGFTGVNIQAVPTYTAIANGTAAPSTANSSTLTVGGTSDVVKLLTF
jgi:hypothetical protein